MTKPSARAEIRSAAERYFSASNGETLKTGDAAKVVGEVQLEMTSDVGAELILIDVPLDFEPIGVWAGER